MLLSFIPLGLDKKNANLPVDTLHTSVKTQQNHRSVHHCFDLTCRNNK